MSDSSICSCILDFMIGQNRPYSVTDILNNLHNHGFGKTAVQKSIDELVSSDKLKEKINGKQKAYFVNQVIHYGSFVLIA